MKISTRAGKLGIGADKAVWPASLLPAEPGGLSMLSAGLVD
jgi:hypothetical protein